MNEEKKKYEQKNNSGAIFKNQKKTEETHSDYNGTAKIDGKEYWVNAWVNNSNNGTKYMQLKFAIKADRIIDDGTATGAIPDGEMPF